MKTVSGYVRETPSGDPVPNAEVTVKNDDAIGLVIPAGGMYAAQASPIITDAAGYFLWQTELSPGPIKIEADTLIGGELKVRSGREMMQADDMFISDMDMFMRLFTPGVFPAVGNEFETTAVTGQMKVKVTEGAANMLGRLLQTHTDRTLDITPNTTIAIRHDLVVLEQHVGGPYIGRQNIKIIYGTVSEQDPDTNDDVNIFQHPIARVTTNKNATSITVETLDIMSTPKHIDLPDNDVTIGMLNPEVKAYIDSVWPGLTIKNTANATVRTRASILQFGTGLTTTAITSGAKIDVLTSLAGLTDTTIASPANNQVLTYSGGKWKNIALPAPPVIPPPAPSVTLPTPNFIVGNFDGGFNTGSNYKVKSVSFTLKPGKYLIEISYRLSATGRGGSGGLNMWIGGSGAASGADLSARVFETDSWISRGCDLTSLKLVTVTANTVYTADAWIAHQFGTNSLVGSGTLFMTAS